MKYQYVNHFLFVLLPVLFVLPGAVAADIGPIDELEIEPIEIIANWDQTDFWFRDDDGAEASATGFGSSNTPKNTNITNVVSGAVFRLRFGIRVTRMEGTLIPRLEFKQGSGCTTGSWTVVTPTSGTFNLRLSDNFNDGSDTTEQITSGQFVAGKILESTNPAPSLNLARNKNTEYEWSLQTSGSIMPGAVYSFRITNDGIVLDDYSRCPLLTVQPGVTSGGGDIKKPVTFVAFYGRAFPGAKIFVVDKSYINFEKTISQNIVVDEDGFFQINFADTLREPHSFGLLVKDKEDHTTQTKFFNIDVANDFIMKNILVPPTTGFLERLVSRGKPVIVSGNASPNNNIALELDGKIKEFKVEKDGSYKIALNTDELELGTHQLRVKQIDTDQKQESDFSPINVFTVSSLESPKTDLSGDGVIDIRDWSIFLSNWGSKDESKKKLIDLNNDGKMDISDFSIFIRTLKK